MEELQIKTERYLQDILVGVWGKSELQRNRAQPHCPTFSSSCISSVPHSQKSSAVLLRAQSFCKEKEA